VRRNNTTIDRYFLKKLKVKIKQNRNLVGTEDNGVV
jgi:hypothetical protein